MLVKMSYFVAPILRMLLLMLLSLTVVIPAVRAEGMIPIINIMFCSGRSIYQTCTNGKVVKVFSRSSDSVLAINGLSASRDGKKIVFVELVFESGIFSQFYIMDADSHKVDRLVKLPYSCSNPSISPDGKKIAFVREESQWEADSLCLMETSSKKVSVIAERLVNPGSNFVPSWSPDGNKVLFDSINCTVAFADLMSCSIKTITNGDLCSLSTDGEIVVYRKKCSGNEFCYRNLENIKDERFFFSGKDKKIRGFIWSSMTWASDNRLVGFYTYKETFWGKTESWLYIYDTTMDSNREIAEVETATPNGMCCIILKSEGNR